MVRTYKKKTKRGEWSTYAMKTAIDKVLSKEMGYKKAASAYTVPQTTLERYVKKIKDGGEVTLGLPLGPKKTIFTPNEEAELEAYLKYMEGRLFGLTTIELRRLAYQLAVKNGKARNFNTIKEMAGVDWLKSFLKRHQNLSIRKPAATSAARAMGFNRVAVSKFYKVLGDIYNKFKLTPDKIYNCNETVISVVSKTKSKILAMEGRKQVGSLSSAERGQTITVEICFNAAGAYMPPLMIFPRQRMKPKLLDHAPPGTTALCNPQGWMTSGIFLTWFKKFIKFSGATPTNQVLLLLDGHSSHTQNLNVIDLARENGVIILCFPPHCTHKMQPTDVAFMKPLSSHYDHAVTGWLKSHPGREVTVFQISEIFGNAYIQAATISTAINAFRKCGIWPYNQNNFTDADFISAETTNVQTIAETSTATQQKTLAKEPQATTTFLSLFRTEITIECLESVTSTVNKAPVPELEPGCSYSSKSPIREACRVLTSSFENPSPCDILTSPSVQQTEKRKQYRRRKTVIINSTIYKNELEKLETPKKTSNPNDPRLKRNAKNKPKTKHLVKTQNSNDEDTICLYCNDVNQNFLSSSEPWVGCQLCGRWAHNACAGVYNVDPDEIHICLFCKTNN